MESLAGVIEDGDVVEKSHRGEGSADCRARGIHQCPSVSLLLD